MRTSMQSYDKKIMARAVGRNLQMSFKATYEVMKFIKGRSIEKSINMLEEVTELKRAIPYTRYNRDTPHRRGKIAAGRFPKKVSEQVIVILKSLKANAENKGLTGDLTIIHAAAQKPALRRRAGRVRGLRKHASFEVVATPKVEKKTAKSKPEPKKTVKPKTETKPKKKVETKK
tara:strand:- start:2638 stop:3159 length:522 start_codon:yes stop_codon:yes gene_type:complete